ncbi:MAG: hypothetical protein HC886_01495 [Leptolyngbyaceae cyanobacterium SM1_1_3]|nr:hypothetical protein [Leptolyngbyaceae cyanobacterium SM1_1_3]NJN03357.1 hypothetical protein [Leptolyngbyaceae cyanobacterium RM1_1_2]NJO09881.1 hypothetical protein [Leptolyngbyaceae cyanobacterium SL_1_1]
MNLSGSVRNGKGQAKTFTWPQQTVRQFFKAYSWEGQQPSQTLLSTADEQPLTYFWSSSVGSFFGTFPWKGISEVAAPSPSPSIQPEALDFESLTLEAFADLF